MGAKARACGGGGGGRGPARGGEDSAGPPPPDTARASIEGPAPGRARRVRAARTGCRGARVPGARWSGPGGGGGGEARVGGAPKPRAAVLAGGRRCAGVRLLAGGAAGRRGAPRGWDADAAAGKSRQVGASRAPAAVAPLRSSGLGLSARGLCPQPGLRLPALRPPSPRPSARRLGLSGTGCASRRRLCLGLCPHLGPSVPGTVVCRPFRFQPLSRVDPSGDPRPGELRPVRAAPRPPGPVPPSLQVPLAVSLRLGDRGVSAAASSLSGFLLRPLPLGVSDRSFVLSPSLSLSFCPSFVSPGLSELGLAVRPTPDCGACPLGSVLAPRCPPRLSLPLLPTSLSGSDWSLCPLSPPSPRAPGAALTGFPGVSLAAQPISFSQNRGFVLRQTNPARSPSSPRSGLGPRQGRARGAPGKDEEFGAGAGTGREVAQGARMGACLGRPHPGWRPGA